LSEEKELQEPNLEEAGMDGLADFVDLADLGDLDAASNMDVFGELGDIGDLGDIPDLSEALAVSDEAPAMEEMSDIPIPDAQEDIPLPAAAELESDVPLPELSEESETLDTFLSDLPEEAETADQNQGTETLDAFLSDLPEEPETADLDEGTEMKSVDPKPDAPDIFSDSSEKDDLFKEVGETDSQASDLTEDVILDDALASVLDGSMEEGQGAESEASLPDMDASSAAVPDALEDGMGLDDSSIDAALSELDLDGADVSIDDVLGASDAGADSVPEGDGGSIDSMLGGLLDNLDMNGSIEESGAAASEEADGMADILNLGSDPFGGAESIEDLGDVDQVENMLDVSEMIPDAAADGAQEKEPGLLKKVFGNVITDEIAEQERMEAQKAEEQAAQKAEEDAKAKEAAEAEKAEKKAVKEAAKAEKKKQKEAMKAEKAAKKAEQKAKREEEEAAELEVVGKLNKVGVSIIAIATILFLTFEIAGTNLFSYASAKKEALNYFEMGKYTEAYQEAIGTDMRNKDEESYNKIKVVMKVQQSLNAYQNYDRIKYYPEALDSLLRGLKRYDSNIEEGMELEVENDMMTCRKQILTLLQEEFNLSEAEAYSIIALGKDAYDSRVIELGLKKR